MQKEPDDPKEEESPGADNAADSDALGVMRDEGVDDPVIELPEEVAQVKLAGRWVEQELLGSKPNASTKGQCEEEFGTAWLSQWAASGRDMCSRQPTSDSELISTITCRYVP